MLIQILMKMLTVREDQIDPKSMGAKHWMWIDNGQIKVSARLFMYFGPPISILLLLSLPGGIMFISGNHSVLNTISFAYVSIFILFFLGISVFNRVIKKFNSKSKSENDKKIETSGVRSEEVDIPGSDSEEVIVDNEVSNR